MLYELHFQNVLSSLVHKFHDIFKLWHRSIPIYVISNWNCHDKKAVDYVIKLDNEYIKSIWRENNFIRIQMMEFKFHFQLEYTG